MLTFGLSKRHKIHVSNKYFESNISVLWCNSAIEREVNNYIFLCNVIYI